MYDNLMLFIFAWNGGWRGKRQRKRCTLSENEQFWPCTHLHCEICLIKVRNIPFLFIGEAKKKKRERERRIKENHAVGNKSLARKTWQSLDL